jgi:magnesium-transporting ATPase (P-type)
VQAQVKGFSNLERSIRMLTGDNQVLKHKIASDVARKMQADKAAKRKDRACAAALTELQAEATAKDTEVCRSLCCIFRRPQLCINSRIWPA